MVTEKIKITYILSGIDKAVAFEWISEQLDTSKFELSFILLNVEEPYLLIWLREKKIEVYFIKHEGKKSYLSSSIKILQILQKVKPQIVHTHLFDANLLGLSCAKLLGIKKRIYTRHHSTYHHDNYPNIVKYDKICNRLATKIVAISKNVKNILEEIEGVNSNKIELIPHGFDLQKFSSVSTSSINQLKKKYKIKNSPVIGVVARYVKLKGIQYIIPAFKNILKDYPGATLVLANANGTDKLFIQELLKDIPKNNLREITFESDLFGLYQLFDIYVHVPINAEIEAYGQTYVEALASGIPSIFTKSGIANEFITNENAIVVPFKNSDAIEKGIRELLSNEEKCQNLIENGKKSIQQFNLVNFVKKLEDLYR